MPTINAHNEGAGCGCIILSIISLMACIAISPWLFALVIALIAMLALSE